MSIFNTLNTINIINKLQTTIFTIGINAVIHITFLQFEGNKNAKMVVVIAGIIYQYKIISHIVY